MKLISRTKYKDCYLEKWLRITNCSTPIREIDKCKEYIFVSRSLQFKEGDEVKAHFPAGITPRGFPYKAYTQGGYVFKEYINDKEAIITSWNNMVLMSSEHIVDIDILELE